MKVFLGGTCSNTTWRDLLIPLLEEANIEYFNPIVSDWNEKCQAIEENEKWNYCDVHLYVITPKMEGVFSIAEIMDSATTFNGETIFVYSEYDDTYFTKGQIKSLEAIRMLLDKRYTHVLHGRFSSMKTLVNSTFQQIQGLMLADEL